MRRYTLKQLRVMVRGAVPAGGMLRRWWIEAGPAGALVRVEYDQNMGTGPRVLASVGL